MQFNNALYSLSKMYICCKKKKNSLIIFFTLFSLYWPNQVNAFYATRVPDFRGLSRRVLGHFSCSASLITMTHLFVSRGRDLAAYLNLLLFSRPFIVSLCALNQ